MCEPHLFTQMRLFVFGLTGWLHLANNYVYFIPALLLSGLFP